MARELAGPDTLLNFAVTMGRYEMFGEDAANRFDGRVFEKAIIVDDRLYLLRLTKEGDRVLLDVLPEGAGEQVWKRAETLGRKILGLPFALEAFYDFAQADTVLAGLTRRFHGFRPTLSPDPFEMVVTSITAQQINLKFAFTVRSRLVRAYGGRLELDGQTYYAFPTPAQLAGVSHDALRQMQFSQRKAEYITGLAQTLVDGELDFDELAGLDDDELINRLTRTRGLGRWTAEWFMARYLGRGHIVAAGDLGVRKAIQHFYFDSESKSEKEIREFAARWGEFANLAVHYTLAGLYRSD